jgi:hypothetical protein
MDRAVFRSEVKAFDDENLVLDHFISTESSDRSQDVMLADGMMMHGMPVVLEQHGLDPKAGMEPIAKPLSLTIGTNANGAKGIVAKTKYFPDDTGKRLYRKAKEGYMPYWSIGFNVHQADALPNGGQKVRKWELVEYSQVSCPANPEATMIKSVDQLPASDADLEKANVAFAFGIKQESPAEEKQVMTVEIELKKKDSRYFNADGTFKNGFDGCVAYMQEHEGHSEESAKKICAYIARNKRKDAAPNFSIEKIEGKACSPEKGEKEGAFMSRCIRANRDAGKDQDQAVAICASEWDKSKKTASVQEIKSVAQRVAQDIPSMALERIFYAMMNELWGLADPKQAKGVLDETYDLMLPHAIAFSNAVKDNRDGMKAVIDLRIKNLSQGPAAADQAPATPSDPAATPPQSQPDESVLDLAPQPTKAAEPVVEVSGEDVKRAVCEALGESARAQVRKLQGKLD